MHTDRCGNTCRQKCCANEADKKLKYESLCIEIKRMLNIKCMIIPIITGTTGMVKKKTLKENFGSHNKETFNRLTTKDICTWNITHNMEITAV